MTTPTTRVGYVGLDHHHCRPYLRSLAETAATVTAACEPSTTFDSTSVEGLGDVPVYDDPVELLDAEDIDALWVTLSNDATPAVVEAALDRDVDVFTEKPAARTATDLEPLLAAEADSDATVCVSYPWRAHPLADELRRRIDAGELGDLRSFDARFFASKVAHRDAGHYLFDRAASRGGILQWLGIHWLDLFGWLFEDPVTRVSATTTYGTTAADVEDGGTVVFETRSGAIGSLRAGYYLGPDRYDTHVGVVGTDATASWDPIGSEFGFDGEAALVVERTDGTDDTPRRTVTHEYTPTPGYGGEWGLAFIERFLDARRSGGEVPVDLSDALAVLRLLDAVYDAAESGRWVAVDGVSDHTAPASTPLDARRDTM
ncbi:Gfo/Idh/MocA family protein [Halomarina oriensis]|uniref:Gfo/Idh/MocA family oxidoreductase n=1 Tax=Halomarina oriensis TaxID=671145 RepID=A0A6B0GM82_9EURY|nr:Gfo/Idh/MocA family oxidoreductase [Halomarina oriensis]MWG35011.1 gfo/Idh/MocA family oxidoreductase [Halomarina oriensis]